MLTTTFIYRYDDPSIRVSMPPPNTTDRLTRIEELLEGIPKGGPIFAHGLSKRELDALAAMPEKIDKIDSRVGTIERNSSIMARFFWLFAAAIVTGIVGVAIKM